MFYTVDQYGVRFSEDKTELIMAPRTLSGDYVIPETVMEIHTYAFDSCKNLERITLPNTISKLGIGTFRCCENLKTVIFNSSIVSIAHSCFASCYSLQEIQLPRTVVKIDKQAFFECRSLEYVDLPDNCICDEQTFEGCTSLKAVIIPSSWTEIPKGIFLRCESLEDIIIPNQVLKISENAFANCTSLFRVYIEDSVTDIATNAFANCNRLTQIRFGLNLKHIEANSFSNCNNIRTIFWDAVACSDFEDHIFFSESIKHCHIGNNVKYIPAHFCQYQNSLEEIVIPNNVERIGNYAFMRCNPRYVYLGKNITSENFSKLFGPYWEEETKDVKYASNLFYYCNRLDRIEVSKYNPYYTSFKGNLYTKDMSTLLKVGKSIKGSLEISASQIADFACANLDITGLYILNDCEIGKFAFSGCHELQDIHFGKKTQLCINKLQVESFAFYDCPKLSSIFWNVDKGNFVVSDSYQIWGMYCGHNVTERQIRRYDFSNQITKIEIGRGVSVLPSFISKLLGVHTLTIPGNVVDVTGGLPPNLKELTLDGTEETLNAQNFTYIGDSIISKDGSIFIRYIGKDSHLTIPNGIKTIAHSALSYSTVKQLTLPKSIEEIGNLAFAFSCLEEFNAPSNLRIIGDEAFKECRCLRQVTLNDKLQSIKYGAFKECISLEQILIPYSSNIEHDILESCSSLEKLTIRHDNLELLGLKSLTSIIWDCEGDIDSVIYGNDSRFLKYRNDKWYDYDVSVAHQITEMEFTDKVKIIPGQFANYMSIKEVNIPKSIKHIGWRAFYNCPQLNKIVIHSMDFEFEMDFCHFDACYIDINGYGHECVPTKIIYEGKDVTEYFQKKNKQMIEREEEAYAWHREIEEWGRDGFRSAFEGDPEAMGGIYD